MAVDDKSLPDDWLCVVVEWVVPGQVLGEAKRLRVTISDSAKRIGVAMRVARNVDELLRGVGAQTGNSEPEIVFAPAPLCSVRSQF